MQALNKIALLTVSLLLVTGCNSTSEDETLTVSAQVTMMLPADTAELYVDVYASAPTRKAAMEQIVKEHNLIKADLPQIEGITNITFEAEEIEIRQIPDQDCAKTLYQNLPEYSDLDNLLEYYDLCPNTAFSAHINMGISVRPAELVGEVIGYATLSEVASINLSGFKITDIETARINAKAEAAGKIRKVAQNVAEKTGVSLGKITKLSFKGDTHFTDEHSEYADEVVVTGSRIKTSRDTVTLDIDPELIEIRERVTATFKISE